MVWLLSNWWHVAQPLPPAAWSPEQGSPCVHVLLTSSAGEVIHLKSKHRLPSPLNWLFFLLDQFPKMVHWLAAGTAVLAQKRGWHRLSDGTHQVSFHLFLKSVSDRAFLICTLPVGGKACACSRESLFSHFWKEQPKHQPTTKHFSTCFIVYKDHVLQEIAHYFSPFSIDLGLSLIKCNIYLAL